MLKVGPKGGTLAAMLEKTYSGALSDVRVLAVFFAFSLAIFTNAVCAAQPQDAGEFQRASTTHRLAEFPKHQHQSTSSREEINV
jgi:hypothetical protein